MQKTQRAFENPLLLYNFCVKILRKYISSKNTETVNKIKNLGYSDYVDSILSINGRFIKLEANNGIKLVAK